MSALQAQTESTSNIKVANNLFSKGYTWSTPLSNKLSLQKGLLFTKHTEFNRLEFPLLLKHNISEKWSVLFGTQLSTITNYNNVLSTKYSAFKNLDASIYFGSEYKFSDLVSGQFSLQYSIINIEDTAFKNLNIDNNPLKFNVGVKF
tara:strand:+ start:1651 stop:2091 length:441 start_codon:yes stop_codon:yes gene_type:complete